MEERTRVKAEYRSSLRSKRLIREALVSLMRSKPFEKITITDIVKEADINRGTFYAHFKDTSEVLDSIRTNIVAEVQEAFGTMTPDIILANPLPFFEALSALLAKDSDYYRMLFSVPDFRSRIEESRSAAVDFFMKSTFAERFAGDKARHDRIEMAFDFMISAVIGVYYDILYGKIPVDLEMAPEFMTQLVGALVSPLSDSFR